MNRILLLGGSGILGSEVSRLMENKTVELVSPSSSELDIREEKSVITYILNFRPTCIINCAAWTNVDMAEKYFDSAIELNATAVSHIASAAQLVHSQVIHISTDYVFNGESSTPYLETAKEDPINKYGESKLRGERLLRMAVPDAYIIRTSWLYGFNGKNFVKTMIDKAVRNEEASVVNDQIGSPTNAEELGKGILEIMKRTPRPGVYNFSNTGSCSWFQLARYVYSKLGSDSRLVRPVSSDSIMSPARRPRFTVLSKDKWREAGLGTIPPWEESLNGFLSQYLDRDLELGNP